MSTSIKERIYVTKDDSITKNENNLVNLTLSYGTSYERLEPRRLFPVSRQDFYISLLGEDGVEVAIIKSLGDLSQDSQDVIRYSLDDYYLVPHITRILSITEKNGKITWNVETDRGFKQFDIRNRNHDIRVYPDVRVRVRDSDDNRYVIDNYNVLDKRSKRQLTPEL